MALSLKIKPVKISPNSFNPNYVGLIDGFNEYVKLSWQYGY
jgi:hypothetical protein